MSSASRTALLTGPWRRPEAVRRVGVALGYARTPRWVGALVGEVLLTYREAPADPAGRDRHARHGRLLATPHLPQGPPPPPRWPPSPASGGTGG